MNALLARVGQVNARLHARIDQIEAAAPAADLEALKDALTSIGLKAYQLTGSGETPMAQREGEGIILEATLPTNFFHIWPRVPKNSTTATHSLHGSPTTHQDIDSKIEVRDWNQNSIPAIRISFKVACRGELGAHPVGQ